MNKREQDFCTKLGAWLKTTKHSYSMLIECKVVANRGSFNPETIRKSQVGALNRLNAGLPIVHKISDGAVGSKLVDMIYIAPNNTPLLPYVAVQFGKSGHAYLLPWVYVWASFEGLMIEHEMEIYRIW